MMQRPSSSESDPYALSDEVVPPHIPGADDVIVEPSPNHLYDHIAAEIVVQAKECVRKFGDFHLALSGGKTPQPLYERLMYDPNYRLLPWKRTHLWVVDERRVEFDDAASNFRMISETIVEHAGIPAEQVHPIFALSDSAATDYEQELREALEWREKGQDRLDFVLLGMGDDGHTASLFPFSDALNEDECLMCINQGGETPKGGRVTMTYPLLNSARMIAVLTCGKAKTNAISRLTSGAESVQTLPIKGIAPIGGGIKWYLDMDAAGM